MKQKDFDELLKSFSEGYYFPTSERKQKITDDEYDLLESVYTERFGKRKKIGVEPPSDDDELSDSMSKLEVKEQDEKLPTKQKLEKVLLHRYLGGLDKIKTQKEIDRWLTKNADEKYIIFDKLDGVAAEFEQIDGKMTLHKRGDETHGTDISTLIPFFKIPKLPKDGGVRGELVIPIKTFKEKYADEMNDPRSMVAGLTNSKTLDQPDRLKDVKFIVYQLYPGKGDKTLTKSGQIKYLKKCGFDICYHEEIKAEDITEEGLTSYIKHRKNHAICNIDGGVLVADVADPLLVKDNPKHMIAFKIPGETAVAKVIDIVWKCRKHGLFKPKVKIEPTKVCDVTVRSLTGHNARFIVDNEIGIGGEILITRSNDVIPYIKDVITKAESKLPPGKEGIDWEWNENGVEIRLIKGENNEEQNIAKIVAFFKALGAKYLAEKTVSKLYHDGGHHDIKDFLNLDASDIMEIDGFKKTSAERLVKSIQTCITDVPLEKAMNASGMGGIGMGERKYKKIVTEYPNILAMLENDERKSVHKKISKLGFDKTLDQMVDSLYDFKDWLEEHPEISIQEIEDESDEDEDESESKEEEKAIPKKKIARTLEDKDIVFSGYRADAAMEREINARGGFVKSGVSKKTAIVVAKSFEVPTEKTRKGEEFGAELILLKDFMTKYIS